MNRGVQRLASVVAGMLATTGALVGASAPAATSAASAATGCSGASGVTVVVDFNELGGTQVGCDPTASGYAAQSFKDAGFSLSRAQQDPSFVCRVNGLPGEDVESCTDAASANSYWSLWISDGKSGTWGYATRGVDSLRVPEGGYIAFSWDQVGGNRPPGYSPTPRAAAPTTTPNTKSGGSGSGSKHSGGSTPSGSKQGSGSAGSAGVPSATPSASSSASTSASASPSASASTAAKKKRKKQVEPTASALTTSATPQVEAVTAGPPDTALASDDDNGGFPVWAAGLLAVVVLGAAGAVPLIRARR